MFSFTINLPDFSDDPIASLGAVGFSFSVGEREGHRVWLEPESKDLRVYPSGWLKLAASYPTEVVFVQNPKLK
jgi:hypothetical protein